MSANTYSQTIIERTVPDEAELNKYNIAGRRYGKAGVQFVHLKRDGPRHTFTELEVTTSTKLSTDKEYTHGDNSDIISTDAHGHAIYILAKKHGIESPEKFASILATHFLDYYPHIEEVKVDVEEYPWQRAYQVPNGEKDVNTPVEKHNHAFILTPTQIHHCSASMRRGDLKQTVVSGLRGMHILKTSQSTFYKFWEDDYRLLPDSYDRIFSTVLDCLWEYSYTDNVKFSEDWNTVRNIFIQKFAGDPKVGVVTFSLQNVLYKTAKEILDVLPQVSVVTMTMPNKLLERFDITPFKKLVPGENNEVYLSTGKSCSMVHIKLARKDLPDISNKL